MVEVRFREGEATIDNYRWQARNRALAGLLNALLDPEGPAGYDPDPDYHAARAAIKYLGNGHIVHADPPEAIPGRVY